MPDSAVVSWIFGDGLVGEEGHLFWLFKVVFFEGCLRLFLGMKSHTHTHIYSVYIYICTKHVQFLLGGYATGFLTIKVVGDEILAILNLENGLFWVWPPATEDFETFSGLLLLLGAGPCPRYVRIYMGLYYPVIQDLWVVT